MAKPENAGLLAEFESPRALLGACEQIREAGFTRWDAFSPFPVHGLDRAMGLRQSRLPWIVLVLALTGTASALLLQWWTSAVDYPMVIGGKPFFSWQAFVPVCFEVTVLFGALGAFLGMLGFNQLPRLYNPLFRSERFERVSDDRFFICIEEADPKFESESTEAWLRELGAIEVERVA